MTGPRPIRVTIDRLVLHGVAHADAAAVERAFKAELEAQMALAPPDPALSGGIGRLTIAPQSGPLGRGAGQALAQALSGRERR